MRPHLYPPHGYWRWGKGDEHGPTDVGDVSNLEFVDGIESIRYRVLVFCNTRLCGVNYDGLIKYYIMFSSPPWPKIA